MKADKMLGSFKGKFKSKIKNPRLEKKTLKLRKKHVIPRIWFGIDRKSFKEAVKHLCKIHPNPHFAVISGYQIGEKIELVYHFTLNYGQKHSEIALNMKVSVPVKNPVLPTITDLIPGALISEREIQEMLGVKIEGIPDGRRLFLDKGFPKGVYPWRRDKTGPDKLVRNLHEGGKS